MNAIDWRKEGFKVLFRVDTVLLVNVPCEMVHVAPNNGGQWTTHDDLTSFPWETRRIVNLPIHSRDDVMATVAGCYCDTLVDSTCDFCSGCRTPQNAVKPIRIITRECRHNVVIIEYQDGLGNQWATQFSNEAAANQWCQAHNLPKTSQRP